VQPIINLLRDHLLDSDLIYGDETTVQVLKEPGRQAQSKSFMWAQMNGSGPPVRLFAYAPGRGTVHAQKLYAGIRPFVVGRRSWLFADTVGGANASANLYSLIETARANGVEPYRYLVALFKKLPLAQTADEYEALLPWNIALPTS